VAPEPDVREAALAPAGPHESERGPQSDVDTLIADLRDPAAPRPPPRPPPREWEGIDEEVQERLESPDPAARADAVWELDPVGTGLDPLLSLLVRDSDPQVRVAAAEQLADSDSFAAITGLLDALQDTSPRVIIAILESLEINGDESIVPEIEPLLEHPDQGVREAAAIAIEMLE
jgi:HEAT repeat protein